MMDRCGKTRTSRSPYLSHSVAVDYILAQYDFSEDVVVAGALHDIIEDVVEKKNKPNVEAEMKARFGRHVHQLVRFVTQTKRAGGWKLIDWDTRGELYRKVMCDPGRRTTRAPFRVPTKSTTSNRCSWRVNE